MCAAFSTLEFQAVLALFLTPVIGALVGTGSATTHGNHFFFFLYFLLLHVVLQVFQLLLENFSQEPRQLVL